MKMELKSFSDSSITYNLDLENLTCTCPDFTVVRKYYDNKNPLRLCKHLIDGLAETKSMAAHPDLVYFKKNIEEYYERGIGFATNFIFKDMGKLKVLYTDDSAWITI